MVQIPYEGYFTQTVEVVKCLSNKCQFLQGSCLASPRWVSLLVAEIYYPDTFFPTPEQPAPGRDPIKVLMMIIMRTNIPCYSRPLPLVTITSTCSRGRASRRSTVTARTSLAATT